MCFWLPIEIFCEEIGAASIQVMNAYKTARKHYFPPLNSFLPWIIAALQLPKKHKQTSERIFFCHDSPEILETWNFDFKFQVFLDCKAKKKHFILLVFGRIYGVPICLRFYLTFSTGNFTTCTYAEWFIREKAFPYRRYLLTTFELGLCFVKKCCICIIWSVRYSFSWHDNLIF